MSGDGDIFWGEPDEEDIARLRTVLEAGDGLSDAADPLVAAHGVAVASATRAVLAHLGAD